VRQQGDSEAVFGPGAHHSDASGPDPLGGVAQDPLSGHPERAFRDVDEEPLPVEVGGSQRGPAGQHVRGGGDQGQRHRGEVDEGQRFGRCGETESTEVFTGVQEQSGVEASRDDVGEQPLAGAVGVHVDVEVRPVFGQAGEYEGNVGAGEGLQGAEPHPAALVPDVVNGLLGGVEQ
jgi:hypothetical protein